jgi:hypothetical protein
MNNLHTPRIRPENEAPQCICDWGWKYHHLGIPTKIKMPEERYLPLFRLYVSGFDSSPFGIEWMRFEKDSPVSPLIQAFPHLAFEVEDLDSELKIHDLKILTFPNSPAEGIRVAMIEHNGAPVELIEFSNNK